MDQSGALRTACCHAAARVQGCYPDQCCCVGGDQDGPDQVYAPHTEILRKPYLNPTKTLNRMGQTKYTHLTDQDTSKQDSPWALGVRLHPSSSTLLFHAALPPCSTALLPPSSSLELKPTHVQECRLTMRPIPRTYACARAHTHTHTRGLRRTRRYGRSCRSAWAALASCTCCTHSFDDLHSFLWPIGLVPVANCTPFLLGS